MSAPRRNRKQQRAARASSAGTARSYQRDLERLRLAHKISQEEPHRLPTLVALMSVIGVCDDSRRRGFLEDGTEERDVPTTVAGWVEVALNLSDWGAKLGRAAMFGMLSMSTDEDPPTDYPNRAMFAAQTCSQALHYAAALWGILTTAFDDINEVPTKPITRDTFDVVMGSALDLWDEHKSVPELAEASVAHLVRAGEEILDDSSPVLLSVVHALSAYTAALAIAYQDEDWMKARMAPFLA